MKLHGLIFDLDGTLTDTIPVCIAALQRTFQHYLGREFTPQEIDAMFGPSEEGILQRQLPADTWLPALEMFLTEYARAHETCTAPFDGILALMVSLRAQGLRLGVATGKGPGSAKITIGRLGLAPYFEAIEVGSAEGGVKPVLIRRFLERWGLEPGVVAYVGDAPADIDAAREVGVVPIAAAWAANADAEALAARQPQAIFRQVADFAAWAAKITL